MFLNYKNNFVRVFDSSFVKSKEKFFFDDVFEKGHFYRIVNPKTLSDSLSLIPKSKSLLEEFVRYSRRTRQLFFEHKTLPLEENEVRKAVNFFSLLVSTLDSKIVFFSSTKNTSMIDNVNFVASYVKESYGLALELLEKYIPLIPFENDKDNFLESITLSVSMNPFFDYAIFGSMSEAEEYKNVVFGSSNFKGYLDTYLRNLEGYFFSLSSN